MRLSVRDLVYIGVFAGCWGAIEITVGSVMHALNVPFGGVLLTAAGITMALVGRLYVPRQGSIFLIAVVTALLKMMSIGGIILSPMVAILVEGLIAELCVLMIGPSRFGFLFAGGLSCLWPLVHGALGAWAVGGTDLMTAYLRVLDRGARTLGVPVSWGWALLFAMAGIHVAIGLLAGTLAWGIGLGLRRRGRDSRADRPQ